MKTIKHWLLEMEAINAESWYFDVFSSEPPVDNDGNPSLGAIDWGNLEYEYWLAYGEDTNEDEDDYDFEYEDFVGSISWSCVEIPMDMPCKDIIYDERQSN